MTQYLSILSLFKVIYGLLVGLSIASVFALVVLLCLVKDLDDKFKKDNFN